VYSELVARLTPEPEYPRIPCLTWKRFKIRFYCPPRLSSLHVAVLVLATLAAAEPVPVRHVEGVTFGFLVLKDLHGEILAHGELKQVVTPDDPVVMSDLQFRFRDGSFYREITKFTQKGVFRLVSDQVIEKGPAFKHDSETWVDAATGNVTAKITANGKEKTVTKHLEIPNDAANGLLFNLAKNLRNYDFDYARALTAAAPLAAEYPENPLFLLLAGDIAAKLGHNDEAAMRFHAATAAPMDDVTCTERVKRIAREALAALGASPR